MDNRAEIAPQAKTRAISFRLVMLVCAHASRDEITSAANNVMCNLNERKFFTVSLLTNGVLAIALLFIILLIHTFLSFYPPILVAMRRDSET